MITMKDNLQFISRSALLDEAGLPNSNKRIIIAIFIIVVLFVVWTNAMTINDVVNVTGNIKMIDGQDFAIESNISSSAIGVVHEDMKALISISGITSRKKIDAIVSGVDKTPRRDNNGRVFYQIDVLPVLSPESNDKLMGVLVDGMEVRISVITGERTLLQYYFSKIWDAQNEAVF